MLQLHISLFVFANDTVSPRTAVQLWTCLIETKAVCSTSPKKKEAYTQTGRPNNDYNDPYNLPPRLPWESAHFLHNFIDKIVKTAEQMIGTSLPLQRRSPAQSLWHLKETLLPFLQLVLPHAVAERDTGTTVPELLSCQTDFLSHADFLKGVFQIFWSGIVFMSYLRCTVISVLSVWRTTGDLSTSQHNSCELYELSFL